MKRKLRDAKGAPIWRIQIDRLLINARLDLPHPIEGPAFGTAMLRPNPLSGSLGGSSICDRFERRFCGSGYHVALQADP